MSNITPETRRLLNKASNIMTRKKNNSRTIQNINGIRKSRKSLKSKSPNQNYNYITKLIDKYYNNDNVSNKYLQQAPRISHKLPTQRRIIVIGDIHGDFEVAIKCLILAGCIRYIEPPINKTVPVMNAFFNKKIILNSSGNSFRPLIDVEDMCDAMIWASNRKQSETFNVGRNDNNILIIDLAKKIAKKQKNCKIVINPNAKTDKRSYQVSFNKVKKAGFYPKKNIDNIINGFFRFYSSNRPHNVYENENFFRLKVLKKLLNKKKINKNLEWI